MESDTQDQDASGKIRSMVMTTVIHAFIPFFWVVFAVFIVPRFVAGLAESGVEMPPMTVVVISFSAFIMRYWFICLFILAFLLVVMELFIFHYCVPRVRPLRNVGLLW